MSCAAARRWLAAGLLLATSSSAVAAPVMDCGAWPRWEKFKQDMISADGRVVDASTAQQYTVSEGQAYALVFALVANDRQSFERVLKWTEDNLAGGDLSLRLPAWQWGRRADGSWGVTDDNPASDADVWIAYALGEAARLWKVRRYKVLSKVVANRILAEETALLPRLGMTLLPAPRGFMPSPGVWRLNPSYAPVQALRRLAVADPRWRALIPSTVLLLTGSAPKGLAPEWTIYDGRGFATDPETRGEGSYNAIRVYLWAGMLAAKDPVRWPLLHLLAPMAQHVAARGVPPESINVITGEIRGDGPVGFSAALLPFLAAERQPTALATQLARVQNMPPAVTALPAYYDSVLLLWGTGFHEGRYHFDADGTLRPSWKPACNSPTPRS